jgi:hypothetical protein
MTFELQSGATRRRIFRAVVENPFHDLQALTVTLQFRQQFCEIQLNFQVFRLEIQRPSVAGHGLIELTQIVQNDAQVIERLQKHWRELNSCLVTIAAFYERPPISQDRAQGVPSLGTILVAPNRKSSSRFGLNRSPAPMEHFGMVAMTLSRRLGPGACQRHEPQRCFDVLAVIGRDCELVQDEGGRGSGTRIVFVHLHFPLARARNISSAQSQCGAHIDTASRYLRRSISRRPAFCHMRP